MVEKKISEFVVGEEIQSFFVIKALNIKTSSNNKKYLDLTLADKTGEVNAKLWDVKEITDDYKEGKLIKIRGHVTSWQNQMQLKITKIRPVNEEDDVQIVDYVPSAPLDPNEMYDEIYNIAYHFKNLDLKLLITEILKEYKERLLVAPAAKSNHHAIRSGLLYHMKRMLQCGQALSKIYTNIDEELLLAGIILHDMEKINEMNSDELGIVSEYSKEGQLLGHIIMGIKKIDEVAKRLGVDQNLSLVLQHLVLSHHYEPEYGSPKKPMLPEGELLHYIDMIDARMYDMEKSLREVEYDEFTQPIFQLDRRRLYKYKAGENC